MLRYLFVTLSARATRNVVLVLGLLAISCGLSTYVSANQDAIVRVNNTLDEHWRGTFDILVRPNNAPQPTERDFGLVESNYLSVSRSGISVEQWKEIEQILDVDVAAPVASIGYLRNTTALITLSFPPQSEKSLYRVNLTLNSTNGYMSYPLLQESEHYLINSAASSSSGDTPLALATTNGAAVGDDGSVTVPLLTPPIVWTLVAGIDPAAERKLLSLDHAVINGQYLTDNNGVSTDRVPDPSQGVTGLDQLQSHMNFLNHNLNPSGPNIPLLVAASTYLSLPLEIKIDKLDVPDSKTLDALQSRGSNDQSSGGTSGNSTDQNEQQRLNIPVRQTVLDEHLDYGATLRPMSFRPLGISLFPTQPKIQTTPNLWMADYVGLGKFYLPGAITYHLDHPSFPTNNMLSLVAEPHIDAQTIISLTHEVAFRSLPFENAAILPPSPVSGSHHVTSPFTFNPIGTYDLSKLPETVVHPDPLTYVPLGVYQPPIVQLVRDAAGRLLPGGPVPLHPTLNPASFIPGPPLALTNIAAARFFRGNNCIDAIRVRVAGIDNYSLDNMRKVEAVAARIVKATGLHVDIVAGSSPQQVLVYVPGSADGTLKSLGYVEEPWTTLGATTTISRGIDQISLLMLSATTGSSLLYLISQAWLSTLVRRRELALLGAIGWRSQQICLLVLGEYTVLGLISGFCTLIVALLVAYTVNKTAPLQQATVVALGTTLLYPLAALGPTLWAIRQPIVNLLQRGEITQKAIRKRRNWASILKIESTGWPSLVEFAVHQLLRRQTRASIAVGSFAVAAALLLLCGIGLLSLGQTLDVTILGQFIRFQIQPYHYIMVGSVLLMSTLTIMEHLAVGVLERSHEIALLQAMGWRLGAVQTSIVFEGGIVGLLGGILGMLPVVVLNLVLTHTAIEGVWILVPIILVGIMLLCSLSSLPALQLVRRVSMASLEP